MNAVAPALARDLALCGLSIEPHPMIKPELEDLLRQAHYALDFPKHPGHGDPLRQGRPCTRARHPGPNQKVPGRHDHHAGYPDNTEGVVPQPAAQ